MPRAATRYRAALRGTTTTMRAALRPRATIKVRRNRLTPCTRANGFDCPNRLEKPAARTTICSLRGQRAFIGMMVA